VLPYPSAVRRLAPLALVAVLAACGSSKHAVETTTAAVPKPGPGEVVYQGLQWSVVLDHGKAKALRLLNGTWSPDTSKAVHIAILGPKPNSKQNPATPQVAAELTGNTPLVESALWVDGQELLEKGGGLQPKRGTIYGAPARALAPGTHVAVAYARTATHAAAVAWTFRV
jgi:hypothetical protein